MGITISKNDNNIDITTNTESLIIANNVSGNTITVDKEQSSVITVSTPGPKGDPYLFNANDDIYVGNVTASIVSASGGFVGDLTGIASNAITAVNASNAFNVYVGNDDTGDTSNSILFSNTAGAGYRAVFEDTSLTYDNTNNNLNVAGNVLSSNYFMLGMSGVITPDSLYYVGPSLEGKFGVQWSTRYMLSDSFPNPTSAAGVEAPSALAATGMTVPYQSRLKNANIVVGGTNNKDTLVIVLAYYEPRTSSVPSAGSSEIIQFLGPFFHSYTSGIPDSTYGICPPSLAEITGESTGGPELLPGGFIVPLAYSGFSNQFYIDVQIQLERIGN